MLPTVEGEMTRELWSLPGEGEHIWLLGVLLTIKIPGEALDGRCTLIEFLMPRGISPPLHHHGQEETFTLIDGTLTFVSGDERFQAEPGASWIVPRGTKHTFRVESDTARLVCVFAPAGMDQCFRNAGLPAAAATLPPADADPRPVEEVGALMLSHGHEVFGPPMGPDD
jgi:quercetin dioxygenase-like cupin family protein